MSRLTRDGTAEPVSRDQILRHERTRTGKYSFFLVQLTTCRIGNLTQLIHTLAIGMCDHTYIGCKEKISSWHLMRFLDGGSDIGSTV